MKKYTLIFIVLCFVLTAFGQEENKEFKPEGKVSGIVFGDYFYNAKRDADISDMDNVIQKDDQGLHGLQFRRIYFTYDYKISPKISSRFRLESKFSPGDAIGLAVKDAYLKINVFEGSDLTIGLSSTPTFQVSEKVWGHRYLLKTIADLRKISTSRDLGLKLTGKISPMLKYAVMYGAGDGTKAEEDKFKRYYGHLQIDPVENLTITLYTDVNNKIRIEDAFDTTSVELSIKNNIITPGLFVGYVVKDKFSVGIESFLPVTQNGLVDTVGYSNKKALAISTFAHANVTDNIGVVCRYDYYDPNLDAEYDLRHFVLVGVSYKIHDKVTFTPNVITELYPENADGIKPESSVTGRLSFVYKF